MTRFRKGFAHGRRSEAEAGTRHQKGARFAGAVALAFVLASGWPAEAGKKPAGRPKPPKPDEGEWVRVPAYGTIDAAVTEAQRATVPDPPRSSVEFSGATEAAGLLVLEGPEADGKQKASFTLKSSGQSAMHGGASIDCSASASGQGPADVIVMVNWKLQRYRFRIHFPSVRGQMRCVTTAPRMPPKEDVQSYSPSIPIPSWRDGELQKLEVDPAVAALVARIGPRSHELYDLGGWIEGSLRGKSIRDRFVTDIYGLRRGAQSGIAFMNVAEAFTGQDVPAHVTVSWGLSLDPRRAEGYLTAFLPGPDEYRKWIPKAGQNEDEPGSIVSFVVAERKPGTVDAPPERPRKFKARFELVDVSSEPGTCLNFPAKSAAKKTPDLRFPDKENARDWVITDDGKTATSRETRERHQVFVASYDYGAYGKLQGTLLFDEGEVPASVVHLPDLPYVSVPYDENGNHIADQWEKDAGVFKDNRADWDGDPDPSGQATDGDGLSFYEEYRGMKLKGVHTRLHPKQKDVFIVDKDGLCAASFFEGASRLHVNYVDWDEINPIDGAGEAGTVNFNHATGHVHPKYTIRVLEEKERSSRHEWGTSWSFRENVAGEAKIFAAQIAFDLGELAKRRGPEIDFERGRLGLSPLTPADVAALARALTRVVTVHEIGHLVGVDHHHDRAPLPLDRDPQSGNFACVMRYPFDGLGGDEASLFAYLVRPLTPDRFCETAPDDCFRQINVKWFVK